MNLFAAPTIAQIEAQIRWECEAVERGIRRFREHAHGTALADLPAGRSAFRDIMPGLVAAIRAAQQEARGLIDANGTGRRPPWVLLILCLDAERLAYLTLRALLVSDRDQATGGQPLTGCATTIAASVRTQMEFEDWKQKEAAASRAAKAAKTDHVDLYQALLRNARQIDARAFKSWSRKIHRIRTEPWTDNEKVHLGTKLIQLAVENSAGWFAVAMKPLRGGKTQLMVTLTEPARLAIADIHQRAEVACPLHMPTIIPPKPWQHMEDRKRAA